MKNKEEILRINESDLRTTLIQTYYDLNFARACLSDVGEDYRSKVEPNIKDCLVKLKEILGDV